MATALLDLELTHLPENIDGLDPYTQVYLLIRFHGQPVGKALLPVRNGRIDNPDLRQELVTAAGRALWEQYLRRFLGFHEANFEHAQLPKATIATCTRDRPEDLRRCLQAILLLPNDGQEILVIDNASQTEETRLVVRVLSAFDTCVRNALASTLHAIALCARQATKLLPSWTTMQHRTQVGYVLWCGTLAILWCFV